MCQCCAPRAWPSFLRTVECAAERGGRYTLCNYAPDGCVCKQIHSKTPRSFLWRNHQDRPILFAGWPNRICHDRLHPHPTRQAFITPNTGYLVLQSGKWNLFQRAVAWEEISAEDDKLPHKVEACLFVFGSSVMEYRRHSTSEIELQRECEGIRNTGGADSTKDYIRANPKNMGLVMSVPHSIQPVILAY